MTRTHTTKLIAAALAAASLGLASTAQADDGAGAAGAPAQAGAADPPAQVDTPAPAQGAQDDGQAGAADQDPPEKSQEQLDKDRFDRYCNMKDAEPSHSDKAFCDQYRKTHGMGSSTSTGGKGTGGKGTGASTSSTGGKTRPKYCDYQTVRYDPNCDWSRYPHDPNNPDYEPEDHSTPHHSSSTTHYYRHTEPTSYPHTSAPSKSSLPFTGLEIWQLGLLGLVLAGGGLGVRRLLTN